MTGPCLDQQTSGHLHEFNIFFLLISLCFCYLNKTKINMFTTKYRATDLTEKKTLLLISLAKSSFQVANENNNMPKSVTELEQRIKLSEAKNMYAGTNTGRLV